jgi:Putative DNA-binding domain
MENILSQDKSWKENLGSFLKEPTRRTLRLLLQLEAVEDNDLDFKRDLLSFDSLAKHILAMANKTGGAIVFGVEEIKSNQFSPCGLSSSFDLTDIEKKLGKYIPEKLDFKLIPFHFKNEEDDPLFNDKTFLVVVVYWNPKYIPFIAIKEGKDLRKDIIYIRRNRASEPINYDELQEIFNNRIDTEYSATDERKLIEHLEELKQLYRHIPRTITKVIRRSPFLPPPIPDPSTFGLVQETLSNPDYPEESYESFIKKLIDIKKATIIKLIQKI